MSSGVCRFFSCLRSVPSYLTRVGVKFLRYYAIPRDQKTSLPSLSREIVQPIRVHREREPSGCFLNELVDANVDSL